MAGITAKTIVTKSKIPGVEFCFNPYVGCTHACVYCYAKFMRRYSGHENEQWGHYLDWKSNATELLYKELPRIKRCGGRVLLGSVTDCYLPQEKKLLLTRKSLEVFLEYQIPITVLTKNALIQRDFDLLAKFEDCEVGLSIGIHEEQHARVLEPLASLPQERIDTLCYARDQGIRTFAFLGPVHPFLTDLEKLFLRVAPHCTYIIAECPNINSENINDLAHGLIRLGITPWKYKAIAQSNDFVNKVRSDLTGLCQKHGLPPPSVFSHSTC